jgi:hypothetical protein
MGSAQSASTKANSLLWTYYGAHAGSDGDAYSYGHTFSYSTTRGNDALHV